MKAGDYIRYVPANKLVIVKIIKFPCTGEVVEHHDSGYYKGLIRDDWVNFSSGWKVLNGYNTPLWKVLNES